MPGIRSTGQTHMDPKPDPFINHNLNWVLDPDPFVNQNLKHVSDPVFAGQNF